MKAPLLEGSYEMTAKQWCTAQAKGLEMCPMAEQCTL